MATNMEKLEELQRQKEYKESLKQRNQSNKNKKLTQMEEEQDMEQFIDDSQDNLKNQLKYKHNEFSDEEDENWKNRKINDFLVQKKKTKQTTGIVIQDEEIEEVAQQEIQEVKITQIIKNQEEFYLRQFDQPRIHEGKHEEGFVDIDMDDLLELVQAKELNQKKQQINQPVQKKIQAPHRSLRIEQETPKIQSTISEESIIKIQNKVEISEILEANNCINFYWLDIYEDQINFPGELFLFGKVKNHKQNSYDTCTICFKDYPKIIYLQYEGEHTIEELDEECRSLMKHFLSLQPRDYKTQIVEKQYAFEIADIPTQKTKYLEVSYTQRGKCQIPLKIPSDRSFFKYALQSTQSTIEQFLINNYIMGPCWLQVRGCRILGKEVKVSTQHALQLENHQLVYNDDLNNTLPLPPLKVVSVAMKCCLLNKEESIIAISMALQDNIDQDGKETPERIHYKSIVRMPKDEQWPIGYRKGQYIEVDSERALLSQFYQIIERFDPDVLIGHDLGQRFLVQIAGRMQKLRSSEWSRLSRLQRMSTLPKHANSKIRAMTIGRLLVDTYEMAKELVKSNDYSLNYLAKKYLNEQSIEIESDVVYEYMSTFQNIKVLIGNNQQDARLTLKVMQKLDIISLTKQLTNIAGNVWNRSLQNQRAERNELLLMHEFYEQGYILPDRLEKGDDDSKYLGGLVFEPKADIYTDFVLLLDFNSLYPSIIMEKNICFTTVIRDKFSFDGNKQQRIGEVDGTLGIGLLPKIIEKLINMRKKAKVMMSKSTGIDKQVWNIKQLAVKLVANSIYGCLGFKSSRFYALPIASLITSTGRDILMLSKALVEKNHNVIYGDTDSMMIYPKLVTEDKLKEVILIGLQIKRQINQNYKKLQIDIDGLFTTLLLLKKKKYAGIKVTNLEDVISNKSNKIIIEREIKGIDMVRREFCEFSKQMQSYVLDILLQIENRDNIFEKLYDLMQEIKNMIDYYVGDTTETLEDLLQKNHFIQKQFLPSQFIITKQLSKPPHEYADANNHPHVLIAKRMIEQGIRTPESLVNHMIHYIICKDDNQKQLAFKAFTPEEMRENTHLKIDTKYYLQSQVFDPISRLCKNINGLLLDKMADILGLHYQKHQKVEYEQIDNTVEKEELLQQLYFVCSVCNEKYSYDQIYIKKSKQFMDICPKQCKLSRRFVNETKLLMKSLVNQYYRGTVQCHSNKEPTLCFSVNKKCFGTCCEEKNRKLLHYSVKEWRINKQISMLSKIVNKQYNQPYQIFDAFNKLENNKFCHLQPS